ncbi:type I phosphodiesterase/nucleotide pyrophosphatase [Candidatus Mancarchaeum acidiphilum]|uniref:Type I phosphodiesterase/nucleotide pyrophosphatase n=1 Tax=Candidatus Mancarchaeum acidiphilum TaxID=1920749 RepID=A0A218NMZ2_9ARCH|nr:alkaline phosphatase family protein [Candidatus Mancarchaeum acidiphilum]ASI13858.1 type I phosphodiesterase/nucleotide pyrophosphatase [Candidatus Mancarchaeum acidiphilum]
MHSIKSDLIDNGFIFPDYKNSSMELAKEVADGHGKMIGGKRKRRFLLFIDGFGYDLLKSAISNSRQLKRLPSEMQMGKISTVFPSFTPTVFTSIDSGKTPAEHGIIGSPIPIREYGMMKDILTLPWSPSVEEVSGKSEAEPLFPNLDTLLRMGSRGDFIYMQFERVTNKNSQTYLYSKINYTDYISFDDLLYQSIDIAESDQYNLAYTYIPDIDHAQHEYTKDSRRVLSITTFIMEMIMEKLLPKLKDNGWELLISSDHGQVSSRHEDINRFDAKTNILKYLRSPPWGTDRSIFFDAAEGMGEKFEKGFEKEFGKNFILYDSSEAIKSGLFGSTKVSDSLRYRFGTHMAIPKGKNIFYYKYPGGREYPGGKEWVSGSSGHHGGLSKEEMEIPLLKA